MLIDSIIHAQQGCDSDMMFLVSKFSGILKKYARKLNYEDAEQDLTADFIELIHHIDIEKLNNTSDGAIVNFLIRSTYHYYVKRLQKERDRKVPEVYCLDDLTDARRPNGIGQPVQCVDAANAEEQIAPCAETGYPAMRRALRSACFCLSRV